MSSSYTPFNPDVPQGAVQNGSQFGASARANAYALWTSLAMGMLPGYGLTCSGGTALEPATFLFSEAGSPGSGRVRGAVTWASGYLSTIVWSVSQDSGANYVTVGTSTFTYDGSGNLTSCTGVAGVLSFIGSLLGRFKAALVRLTSAESTIATLGAMAFQAASAVAITGGSATGLVLGGSGSGQAQLAYIIGTRETWIDLGSGTPANTFTLDFAAGSEFKCAAGNNFTFAVTNEPANGFAQKCVVEVSGGLGHTSTLPSGYTWGGAGEPTWTAGPDLVTVYCRSHASTPVKRFMLSSYGA